MPDLSIALTAFACVLAGGLLGMVLGSRLPEKHLTKESKETINLATALIATLSALVLSLFISSAKSAFDVRDTEVKKIASDVILLDRAMAHYGIETEEARRLLKATVKQRLAKTWVRTPEIGNLPDTVVSLENVEDALRALRPADDSQTWLRNRALTLTSDLSTTRWLLLEQQDSSIHGAFLAILIFWLSAIFTSFGLFAPRNLTVVSVFVLAAVSVGGAIFLVLEMDKPFNGLIQISDQPVRDALRRLGAPADSPAMMRPLQD
jgi:hypothetical protein